MKFHDRRIDGEQFQRYNSVISNKKHDNFKIVVKKDKICYRDITMK